MLRAGRGFWCAKDKAPACRRTPEARRPASVFSCAKCAIPHLPEAKRLVDFAQLRELRFVRGPVSFASRRGSNRLTPNPSPPRGRGEKIEAQNVARGWATGRLGEPASRERERPEDVPRDAPKAERPGTATPDKRS
jgi:hypothetical protein